MTNDEISTQFDILAERIYHLQNAIEHLEQTVAVHDDRIHDLQQKR